MATPTPIASPGLCSCRSIGPEAEQWATKELSWKIQQLTAASPSRFFVHRFSLKRNGEEVRAEAVVAYQDAWECSFGDFTVDRRLRQASEMIQVQPRGETSAELLIERWYFAPRTIRRGGEAVQVWERVENPAAE